MTDSRQSPPRRRRSGRVTDSRRRKPSWCSQRKSKLVQRVYGVLPGLGSGVKLVCSSPAQSGCFTVQICSVASIAGLIAGVGIGEYCLDGHKKRAGVKGVSLPGHTGPPGGGKDVQSSWITWGLRFAWSVHQELSPGYLSLSTSYPHLLHRTSACCGMTERRFWEVIHGPSSAVRLVCCTRIERLTAVGRWISRGREVVLVGLRPPRGAFEACSRVGRE